MHYFNCAQPATNIPQVLGFRVRVTVKVRVKTRVRVMATFQG